jgi:hypothetical protein
MKGSEHPPIFNQFYLIIESLFKKKKLTKRKKIKRHDITQLNIKNQRIKQRTQKAKIKLKHSPIFD